MKHRAVCWTLGVLLSLASVPGPARAASAAPAGLRVADLSPGTTLRYPLALLLGEAEAPDGTELAVVSKLPRAPAIRLCPESRAR